MKTGPQFVCMLWVRSAHKNKNMIPPSEGRQAIYIKCWINNFKSALVYIKDSKKCFYLFTSHESFQYMIQVSLFGSILLLQYKTHGG